jgi:DNA-binding Xre family transcriptional regulator
MNARYRGFGDKFKALAADAGVALSSVQRVTQPDRYTTGVSIDTIDAIAKGLRCEPYELLQDVHISSSE